MTNNNYIDVLYSKGYILNDGEIGFENWINDHSIQLYISPEDDMYQLRIYDNNDEEEFVQIYKSMQTLTAALKRKGLL